MRNASPVGRLLIWVALDALAGSASGLLPCAASPADLGWVWLDLLAVGVIAGVAQLPAIAPLGVKPYVWIIASLLFSIGALVFGAVGALVLIWPIGQLLPKFFQDPASGAIIFAGTFIGGSVMGVVQFFALPRGIRAWRWIPAVGIGAIAVAPLVLTLTTTGAGGPCAPLQSYVPIPLIGAVCGAAYGVLTGPALLEMWRRHDGTPRAPLPSSN